MCLGPIFINCCIPLVSREGVALPFLCTLSQFGWLILCCQSAARSCILSLLPNSQLSCKTGCTETFQWFFGLWYLILQPWRRQCAISFPGRDWVPPPPPRPVARTPELEGLEATLGFTKAGIARRTRLVLFSRVVSVVWCAVVADDWFFDLRFSRKYHH